MPHMIPIDDLHTYSDTNTELRFVCWNARLHSAEVTQHVYRCITLNLDARNRVLICNMMRVLYTQAGIQLSEEMR